MLKPKILFSRCFFEPVRYNASIVVDDFVDRLKNYVEPICVCPEVEIGLGTPRQYLVVIQDEDKKRLIQPETGIDLTDRMLQYTKDFVNQLKGIDGVILKAKSPSCGVSSTKLYKEDGVVVGKTNGFLADELKKTFPFIPLEDEGRLKDKDIKYHFLTRVFSYCELRNLVENPSSKGIVDFHTRYKYLIMTYSQKHLTLLGRIVADGNLSLSDKIAKYKELFYQAFSRKASHKRHINTLMHIFGHISKKITKREKNHFQELLEKYRKNTIELRVLLELIKNFAYRFEDEYILIQKYLEPFPEDLVV
ncbi:MAG: DUF523 and DUF1722 domain-containing protein [Thermodesulfovibrio sp.]|nr:DUF523 and DUF1722 domain-containing protein [Thermodesulfovibrio sp.]